ncbi:Adenosylmethionine-8-amino-7-oxononanoate aminotransferase [Rhodopirellula islandica]|uniref:Adenosylmethionine-8-amino-7-oxononanoate aminotransferase n=1 Tax=Rhodopirellula islandica TaxID=595434 RepID=A0A0J1B5E3_RHOIS|nr:adenosylmethionine--8-amino-7-oxononanoate transaminase [Rhodopirellula islandica]KLU01942.1 Adenosylmethionine-8-amino-7-oxononanoate aminotransferase [Rhodopirellula islandica]
MKNHVWQPYCQMKTAPPPMKIVATEGCHLIGASGQRWIDGMASWWSACHGYNHPHVREAVTEQLARMPHVMFGGITHEPAERLATRLAALAPGDLNHVFFSDSGSVAVEVAMKMAIGHWRRRDRPGRTRFLAFHNAYHGDTTGAMSLCDPQRSMHARYSDAITQQFHVPLPRDESFEEELNRVLSEHADSIAGVFVEPLVQGAGGMRFHDVETLRRIRDACRRHDVLLIADEIATGFQRTGKMFAVDHTAEDEHPVVPDILCLGKALTAGTMSMAVTIARTHVFDSFYDDDPGAALMHGPTFMANPLACSAANASLDLFETTSYDIDRLESVLRERLSVLRELDHVADVRCLGAVGVVQFRDPPKMQRVQEELVQRGVWLRPFGDCLYTTPPLCIGEDSLHQICDAMIDATHATLPSGIQLR